MYIIAPNTMDTMLRKRLYIAICISAIMHMACIAIATYVAYWQPDEISGGSEASDAIFITVLSQDIRTEHTPADAKARPKIIHEKNRDRTAMIAPPQFRTTEIESAGSEKTEERVAEASRGESTTGHGTGDKPGPGSGEAKKQLALIWSKINRSKYYPLHARRNLWEGKPRVTFKIGSAGEIEYVRLAKSCGITLLDEAAVETVKRAAPLPTYPKPITLTIRYSLRD